MATKATPKAAPEVEETPAAPAPKAEKWYTVKLPKERGNDADKVVWVNDNRYIIQRGVDVEVPESVKRILDNEERMLDQMYEYESKVRKG